MREKLLRAKVRDVKCVKVAVLEPSGAYHEIRGDAGQGKSAIIKAIEAAFRGLDPKLVRDGADNAEIELVLSDTKINRVVDKNGNEQLTVVAGNQVVDDKVAKGLLAALWGRGFDPVAWVNLGADIGKGTAENRRRQRDELVMALPMLVSKNEIEAALAAFEGMEEFRRLNLDGIDWEQHAYVILGELLKRAGQVYHDTINKQKKDTEAVLDVTPVPKMRPDCTLEDACEALESARAECYGAEQAKKNRSGLVDQVNRLKQGIEAGKAKLTNPKTGKPLDRAMLDKGVSERTAELEKVRDGIETRDNEIAELEAALADARQERESLRLTESELMNTVSKYGSMQAEMDAQDARIADLQRLEAELAGDGIVVDTTQLRADIAELEGVVLDIERGVRYDQAAAAAAEAAEREALWRLSLLPLLRDGMLNAKLAECELPVENVAIEEDQITVDGKPLWTLGTSEQYVVGVKLGALLNRRLGFMPIDRGESIGSKELTAIYEACQDLDVTAIIAFMDPDGEPGEHCTVMQDGAPVAVETPTPAAAAPLSAKTQTAQTAPARTATALMRARQARGGGKA